MHQRNAKNVYWILVASVGICVVLLLAAACVNRQKNETADMVPDTLSVSALSGITSHGPKDPSILWKYTTPGKIYSSPSVDSQGNIYASSTNGYIYALNPAGQLRWELPLLDGSVSGEIVCANGSLYFSSTESTLYSLDASAGSIAWTSLFPKHQKGEEDHAIGITCLSSGELFVHTVYPSKLIKFEAGGASAWAKDTGEYGYTRPVGLSGNRALVSSDDGRIRVFNSQGAVEWSVSIENANLSTPAVSSDGKTVYASGKHKLYAWDISGELQWTTELPAESPSEPVISADGHLHFASMNGLVFAVEPGGEMLWKYNAGDQIWDTPVVDKESTTFFSCQSGQVAAIGIDGSLIWSINLPDSVSGAPVIVGESKICCTCWDGCIYLLADSSS